MQLKNKNNWLVGRLSSSSVKTSSQLFMHNDLSKEISAERSFEIVVPVRRHGLFLGRVFVSTTIQDFSSGGFSFFPLHHVSLFSERTLGTLVPLRSFFSVPPRRGCRARALKRRKTNERQEKKGTPPVRGAFCFLDLAIDRSKASLVSGHP